MAGASALTTAAMTQRRRRKTFDQFVNRMIDGGASPEVAKQAATAHFELEAKRLRPGQFLPGLTAQR
jgi:hypothetical protein